MLRSESVKCRNCGASSEHTVLMSTNAFGSPDLDLRPPEMQRSTMDTWLQLCPCCGYCAPDIGQQPANAVVLGSEAYCAALQGTDYPELARRFLAFAGANAASDPATAASAYLQAAWVCDDALLVEQASGCRRRAVAWFRRCKPFATDEQGVGTGSVFVDVLRRSGQLAEAAAECATLLGGKAATGMMRKVLEYQQQLIAQMDTDAHRVSDCDKPAEVAAAEKAAEAMARLVEAKSLVVAPHFERGLAHVKRAEYQDALFSFTEAIKLEPDLPKPYIGRALAFRSLGDEASALRDEHAARQREQAQQAPLDEARALAMTHATRGRGICSYCKGSGDCYCKRTGTVPSDHCPRCNGSGTCHVCQGTGAFCE
jgi:tetratricopeptide (TPR) repeat protein